MIQILYAAFIAFLASLSFGLLFQVRGLKLPVAALIGAVGWTVYIAAEPLIASDIPRYFLATVIITVLAEGAARWLRAPVLLFLGVGMITLVPGGGIYNIMLYCVQDDSSTALTAGVHTIGIAGALAMGIVVVSSTVLLFLTIRRRH